MTVDIKHYEYNVETDYKSVRNFMTLQWTTEPPKEPGWYWAMRCEEIQIVNIRNGVAFIVGLDDYCVLELFTHWLGPLPAPEPPKE